MPLRNIKQIKQKLYTKKCVINDDYAVVSGYEKYKTKCDEKILEKIYSH